MIDEYDFYKTHSVMTDPGAQSDLFNDAPSDLASLTEWVRNVQIHEVYAYQAKLALPPGAADTPRTSDAALRFVNGMLERIVARDARALPFERNKDRCFIGTCRDYAVFLCALLRSQGRPARVRCGFAFYFEPESGLGDDHWVTEVWCSETARWRLVDAEIDLHLDQHKKVTIDPLDVSRDQFQVAGVAWQQMRQGKVNAAHYGVSAIGISGDWFMAANVVRDFAALNKFEMLPFDYWGLITEIAERHEVLSLEAALIDQLAAITADDNFDFDAIRATYAATPSIQLVDPIKSWPKGQENDYYLSLEDRPV